MLPFLLILLLLAAVFGILGAVLKLFLILVLAALLFVTVLIWAVAFWFRRRVRAVERALGLEARRRKAVDLRWVRNRAEDPDRPAGP